MSAEEDCPNGMTAVARAAARKATVDGKVARKQDSNMVKATSEANAQTDKSIEAANLHKAEITKKLEQATEATLTGLEKNKAAVQTAPRFKEQGSYVGHLLHMLDADAMASATSFLELNEAPSEISETMSAVEAVAKMENPAASEKAAVPAVASVAGFKAEQHQKLYELLTRLKGTVKNTITMREGDVKAIEAAWQEELTKFEAARAVGAGDVEKIASESKRMEGLVEEQRVRKEEDVTIYKTVQDTKKAVQAELSAITDSCDKTSSSHLKTSAAINDEMTAIDDVINYVKSALDQLKKTLQDAMRRAREGDAAKANERRQEKSAAAKELAAAKAAVKSEQDALAREQDGKKMLTAEMKAAQTASQETKAEAERKTAELAKEAAAEREKAEAAERAASEQLAAKAKFAKQSAAEKAALVAKAAQDLKNEQRDAAAQMNAKKLEFEQSVARLQVKGDNSAKQQAKAVEKAQEVSRLQSAQDKEAASREIKEIVQESEKERTRISEWSQNVTQQALSQAGEATKKADKLQHQLDAMKRQNEEQLKQVESDSAKKLKAEEAKASEELQKRQLDFEKRNEEAKKNEMAAKKAFQKKAEALVTKRNADLLKEKKSADAEIVKHDAQQAAAVDKADGIKRKALKRAETEMASAKAKLAKEEASSMKKIALIEKKIKEEDLKALDKKAKTAEDAANLAAQREAAEEVEVKKLKEEKERMESEEDAERKKAADAAKKSKAELDKAREVVGAAKDRANKAEAAIVTTADDAKKEVTKAKAAQNSAEEMSNIELEKAKLNMKKEMATAQEKAKLVAADEERLRNELKDKIVSEKTERDVDIDKSKIAALKDVAQKKQTQTVAKVDAKKAQVKANQARLAFERLKLEQDMNAAASNATDTDAPKAKPDESVVKAMSGSIAALSCVTRANKAQQKLAVCQQLNAATFCQKCLDQRGLVKEVLKECKDDAEFDPTSVLEAQKKWTSACSCDRNMCPKPAVVCEGKSYHISHHAGKTATDCCDKFVCKDGGSANSAEVNAENAVSDQDVNQAVGDYDACVKKAAGNKDQEALVRVLFSVKGGRAGTAATVLCLSRYTISNAVIQLPWMCCVCYM